MGTRKILAAYGPLDLAGLWTLQFKTTWFRLSFKYILFKFVLIARWLVLTRLGVTLLRINYSILLHHKS